MTPLTLLLGVASVIGATIAQTVNSFNGIVYNCPNVEPIEVAYIDTCPSYSRTQQYKLTGASSSVRYQNSPGDYTVPNGYYTLSCAFRTAIATTDSLVCQYSGGSGQSLSLRSGSSSECPDYGQTFPQTSKRAMVRDLTVDFDDQPQYNCPWNSNRDRYVYGANVNVGTRARATDLGARYSCTINQPSGYSPLSCIYKGDGTLLYSNGGADGNDCPNRLCNVRGRNRRSIQWGVYLEDDPIRRRQVDTTKLRDRKLHP